ncbi:MAG: DUF3047 domain-containing protein [bacterium]
MNLHCRTLFLALFTSALLYNAPPGVAQPTRITLLGDFKKDWQKEWVERKLSARPTKYRVKVAKDSNQVLQAMSIESASALWRPLQIRPGRIGKLFWRWKIDIPLTKNTIEKSKQGDDYAARLYVVFEPHLVSWKTRALCYVWAAREPTGTIYRSPYALSVAMVVVQSGKENKGEWQSEQRDFIADYKKAFGKPPEMVTAVALMVDTDNTVQEAQTWFDDIRIEVSDPQEEAKPRPAMRMSN